MIPLGELAEAIENGWRPGMAKITNTGTTYTSSHTLTWADDYDYLWTDANAYEPPPNRHERRAELARQRKQKEQPCKQS